MHIIVLWLTFISECRTSEIIGLCIQQAEGVGRTSRFPGHELLLNPVKAHQAIRIDDIESPYSRIPSLRQNLYARGMAGSVERPAALDKVHLMP
jgi:hypothetical protein